MANGADGISRQLTLGDFLSPISGQSDLPAKTSARQGLELDSEEIRAYSLDEYLTYSGKPIRNIVPDGLSLKTLEACCQQMKEETFLRSSWHWTDMGMTSNGRILTLDSSECLRTGKGYTLWDILEAPEEVDREYFLSAEQMSRLVFL